MDDIVAYMVDSLIILIDCNVCTIYIDKRTPTKGTYPFFTHKMIAGSHVTIFSKNAEADRKFFKEVFELPNVDAGAGWLIFSSPRATCGIGQLTAPTSNPTDEKETSKETTNDKGDDDDDDEATKGEDDEETTKEESEDGKAPEEEDNGLIKAEFMLTVDDIDDFRKKLKEACGIDTDLPSKMPWGIITKFTLPGGAKLQAYQPLHTMCNEEEESSLPQSQEKKKRKAADPAPSTPTRKRITV